MKLLLMIIIGGLLYAAYYVNAYKLYGCDFESNYKCEVIHGIGAVIPPAVFITVWFESDRK